MPVPIKGIKVAQDLARILLERPARAVLGKEPAEHEYFFEAPWDKPEQWILRTEDTKTGLRPDMNIGQYLGVMAAVHMHDPFILDETRSKAISGFGQQYAAHLYEQDVKYNTRLGTDAVMRFHTFRQALADLAYNGVRPQPVDINKGISVLKALIRNEKATEAYVLDAPKTTEGLDEEFYNDKAHSIRLKHMIGQRPEGLTPELLGRMDALPLSVSGIAKNPQMFRVLLADIVAHLKVTLPKPSGKDYRSNIGQRQTDASTRAEGTTGLLHLLTQVQEVAKALGMRPSRSTRVDDQLK